MAARYVKLVFDTDIPEGTIAFDTLEFDGSLAPPSDIVWDDDGRLFYKPLDGVHFSSGDIFQVKNMETIMFETEDVGLPSFERRQHLNQLGE